MNRKPLTQQRKSESAQGGGTEQILLLLNSLGERLVASERERAALKRTLGEMQERQDRIEEQTETYAEKLEQTYALAEKIEEAINQQGRMNRRLEKMHQERIQMIRKLDRIEETVIETQEALHAKALVLLTGQGVAEESGKPRLSADTALTAPPKAANDDRRFWHGQWPLRVAAMTFVVALGALCGWAIYEFKGFGAGAAPETVETASMPIPDDTDVADSGMAEIPMPPPIADAAPQEIASVEDPAPVPETLAAADVLQASDEELAAKFEDDPDALAAQLNDIEPGSIPDETVVAAVQESAPVTEVMPEPAPASVAPSAAAPAKNVPAADRRAFDNFVEAIRVKTAPLAQRITPDSTLPPMVKDVETKAFAGSAEAQHDLAAIYTAGHAGVKTDYARAHAWFLESALQGVANARYNLGVLYHQGLGVEKDVATAINWYGAAAALGHPEAQYNLGIAHIEGIGTGYDPKAAATFFENAARSGILEAAYNLGLIYENGLLNGERNVDHALYWYKKAADQGSPEARAAMNQLQNNMGLRDSDVEKSIARAAGAINPAKPPPSAMEQAPAMIPELPAPVKKSEVQSLRPEDMVDIKEVAQYIPPVSEEDLHGLVAAPAKAAASRTGAIIAQVQEQLMRMGLYPGPADGISGPQTEDAIRTYQTAHNLPGNGKATEDLLLHLLSNEIDAGAAPDVGSRFE